MYVVCVKIKLKIKKQEKFQGLSESFYVVKLGKCFECLALELDYDLMIPNDIGYFFMH